MNESVEAPPRALVTGGNGKLGEADARVLLAGGYEVHVTVHDAQTRATFAYGLINEGLHEVAAQDVIDELASGADFAELARTRSTGPTAPSGGDLGWFSADSMVEPFGDAVQALDVGAHSNSPVQTQFGWHVILVEEARDQQPPGLDAVRNDIRTLVDRNKLEDYVNGLRDSADVVME
jgi:NAD(P)-dependent dehydrogenase (short-subunit alcohol dehydrogenase family)